MILDKPFPPDPRVENEALSLVQAGFEVFLFCLTYDNEVYNELYKGINIVRYKSNKLTYKLSALAYELPFYSLLMQKKIKHFIRDKEIDVLHIHDIRIAGSVFKANKKYELPLVLDLHDNYPEVMKEYPHLKKMPGKWIIKPDLWKKKEQYFLEKSDFIITVSNEFQDEIQKRIDKKEKLVMVPNTVHQSFFTNYKLDHDIIKRFENNFVLLYIGDTGLRRGLLTAIEAMPAIQKTIKNIKLVIVGISSEDKILMQKVNDLDLKKYVSFEGWQYPDTFPSYIKASKIGISPLYRSKQHDVAYANKLFQYMSFGLPVLVSNATAQKNLVENNSLGLVHFEKDAKDFANKIIELYDDAIGYAKYAKNTESFISDKFHWENTSKPLIEMYKDIKKSIS